MASNEQDPLPFSFSGAWVVLSYCYFLVFHLFPTAFVMRTVQVDSDLHIIVTAWYIAGVIGIGFMCGYRGRNPVIAEPALASIFYAISLAFLLQWHSVHQWGHSSLRREQYAMLFIAAVAGIFLAMFSAWAGRATSKATHRQRE